MPETLQKDRLTIERMPALFRSRTLDYTLMAIGAIASLFGAYTMLVPDSWFLADLAEGWYLGSFMIGGAFLATGFGLFGASIRDRMGHWTTAAVTSFVIAALALAGAVTALVVLIL